MLFYAIKIITFRLDNSEYLELRGSAPVHKHVLAMRYSNDYTWDFHADCQLPVTFAYTKETIYVKTSCLK